MKASSCYICVGRQLVLALKSFTRLILYSYKTYHWINMDMLHDRIPIMPDKQREKTSDFQDPSTAAKRAISQRRNGVVFASSSRRAPRRAPNTLLESLAELYAICEGNTRVWLRMISGDCERRLSVQYLLTMRHSMILAVTSLVD